MLTSHGITSSHTNDCGDGLWQITSLSRGCHNLEGSLATHEAKFLSENPAVLPAGGKGELICLFPTTTCSFGRTNRAELTPANDADFVGSVVCVVKRVAITLTDMITFGA